MKVSYKWIKQYLDLQVPAKELAEKIERTAVEVDEVKVPMDGLKKLVVGQVMAMENHPDSDHLHVCQVDVGEEDLSQIVCGAPNVAVNQKVIVALPGARIGDNIKIKKSKMRGVQSNGMLCALDEIGFKKDVVPSEWADGIYVFDAAAEVGEPVFAYLGMNDALIDIDITPNRGDMLSMNGVANELSAIYDLPIKTEAVELVENGDTNASDDLAVTVDDQLADQYKLRVIKNVTVKPSPTWLQITLWNAGIRPINNVVDITNYILLKYGQPLHAFDLNKLHGNQLQVRLANTGEKIVTLDEEERELTNTDIVIADDNGPVAIAGVMGGLDSEITTTTTDVVLEAAIFAPTNIRKTARRLVLHSEASQRFERGINPDTVNQALDEAAAMINDLAMGEVAKGVIVGADQVAAEVQIELATARVNHVLGTDLETAAIADIFRRLGFKTTEQSAGLLVTVPRRRGDVTIAADLIEEVARIYGYDNLPVTLPTGTQTVGALTNAQKIVRNSRAVLEGLGLTQAISYSLTTEAKAKMFLMQASNLTNLSWPMTMDHSTLRMNLISGLLDDVAYNHAHKVNDVALYEQGRVFYNTDEAAVRPTEVEHIAGAITGSLMPADWQSKATNVDFYQAKGIVEQLIENLGLAGQISYVASADYPEMHPGRTAAILLDEEVIGFVGQVHPATAKAFKINETYVFELDLQKLIDSKKVENQYHAISKYPSVKRDIAVVVDEAVTNNQIIEVIKRRGGAYLKEIHLFDVYNGENVADGKKSMAYSLTYVNPADTLKDEEVTKAFEKVSARLVDELGAEIR